MSSESVGSFLGKRRIRVRQVASQVAAAVHEHTQQRSYPMASSGGDRDSRRGSGTLMLPMDAYIAQAAEAREHAALQAYDDLTSSSDMTGVIDLVRALIQVNDVALRTARKQPSGRSPTPMQSPRRRNLQEQQAADFLAARGTKTLPAGGFNAFVDLYNDYIDYCGRMLTARVNDSAHSNDSFHGGDSTGSFRRMGSADARVINMATSSVAARLNESGSPNSKRPTPRGDDRSTAPPSQRSGATPRGGLSSMTIMQSSDDAPHLDGVAVDTSRARQQRGTSSPDISPRLQRGGATEKYDFADHAAREAAKETSFKNGKADGKGSYRARNNSGGVTSPQSSDRKESNGATAPVYVDTDETTNAMANPGRQRTFRARRLSKDIITDHGDAGGASKESPQSSRGSSLVQSPRFARHSREELDAAASTRKVSLEQLVQFEAEEEEAGNPDSLNAVQDVIVAAPTTATSAGGHMTSVDTPSKARRTKPSQQPKTAEKTAALQHSDSITLGGEMEADDEDVAPAFDESIVGTYSCHGQEPGRDGAQAKINQDCACMGHPFAGLKGTAMFSVFDGHGKYGHEVSQEAMHTIFHMLEEGADELYDEPAVMLADAFEACNIHLRMMACEPEIEVNALESGTCAVVAYMHHRQLLVASVGDCRCVLGKRDEEGVLSTVPLSTDHKVDLPHEQERIEGHGGWVRPGRIDPEDGEFVPARMYEVEGKPGLGPGLCVSRSLGDLNALRCGLIPTPEVFKHSIGSEDRFLILASDGVWEFIDNEEAVETVDQFHRKGRPAMDACRYLIAKAAVCWRKFEGDYRDDISAVVIYLDEVLNVLADEDIGKSDKS